MNLETLHSTPFYEIAALMSLAAGIGFLGRWLRQPMVICFIITGILSGPSALNLVQSHESIKSLAELGVAVLLFLVGLKLDLKLVRTLGVVSLATGLGQVFFTSVFGFAIGMVLGFDVINSIYIAVALTFSSTIIIVKLLSDKKEADSLHGKIAIGFLIVQDLVVVIAMMVLSALGIGSKISSGQEGLSLILQMLFAGTVILATIGMFIRFVADRLVRSMAHSTELLVVFAIAWAAALAALGDYYGFSKELGGLLAGVSLASTPFRESIVSRLASLRDFLLLFFFIFLGASLDLSLLGPQVFPALIFSAFVLIGNPLIVMVIMRQMGYRKRTGFLAGLTVAQISEFSLIFIAMGVTIGHVSTDALGLVTLVGLITIALSVYMITYSHQLYAWLESMLGFFERKTPYREEKESSSSPTKKNYDVILFGLGRFGSSVAQKLIKDGIRVLAVDFNPEVVRKWKQEGADVIYGDINDQEFIGTLPLHTASWVVTSISQHDLGLTHQDPRLTLIDELKRQGFQGRVAFSTYNSSEEQELLSSGAHTVFLPFHDAADRAVEKLKEKADIHLHS
jgi:Kef-type K+ transport system membrane component KefB